MIIGTEYLPGNKLRVTFRKCPSCDKTHQLTVNEYEFENYMDGVKSLEKAFPYLTPAERELFLTAIDGECFRKMASAEEY
jgi:hypothetical protein